VSQLGPEQFHEGVSAGPGPRGSDEDFAAALAAEGVPAGVGAMLGELFAVVLDGRNSHTTDGVQRALGRPPKDFSDYAREVAATGVWTP